MDEEGVPVEIDRPGEEGPQIGEQPIPLPGRDQSSVPYDTVYADFVTRAQQALEGSYIPLGMRQYVRDYFSALEP